jgi:hypothetical protein
MSNQRKPDISVAKLLWRDLGDVPVNDDDLLDEDFVTEFKTFKKGEGRLDVWHWFESFFNLSVVEDLMGVE